MFLLQYLIIYSVLHVYECIIIFKHIKEEYEWNVGFYLVELQIITLTKEAKNGNFIQLWMPSMDRHFVQDLPRDVTSFRASIKSVPKPKDLVNWSIITWEKLKEFNKP